MSPRYTTNWKSAEVFAEADRRYDALKTRLTSAEMASVSHSEVEEFIERDGREILRALYQSHLDLRGAAEPAERPTGSDGTKRTHRRAGTSRPLMSLLGPVRVTRTQYEQRGVPSVHPVDAVLNLPAEMYSLPVRRRSAITAVRMSFDAAVQMPKTTTGALVPKRQFEELVVRAARDFEAWYGQTELAVNPDETRDLLVVTTDGKGVVMRRDGLRPATRKAADTTPRKLETRLTQGEKPNRKRMAAVAAVYTVKPWVRTAADVLAGLRSVNVVAAADRPKRPRPEYKRAWASVERDAEQVIDEAFAEALSRDPRRDKRWVVVVDGAKAQLGRLERAARRTGTRPTIVLDFIHVLEYLWKAAPVFNPAGSPEAEAWVLERLGRILNGQATRVAAAIRRSATKRRVPKKRRAPADRCANYISNHAAYMRYDEYLAAGLPIASGVIEGTCRHLINDRLDITGASWGLPGAEAILKLRSIVASGDFNEYWAFHEEQELQRNHRARYADAILPTLIDPARGRHLRVVK